MIILCLTDELRVDYMRLKQARGKTPNSSMAPEFLWNCFSTIGNTNNRAKDTKEETGGGSIRGMEECHVDSHRNTRSHTKGNDFDGKAKSPVNTANEEVIKSFGRDQMMLQARQENAWEFRAHDFGLFPMNLAATISFSGNETDYDTHDGLVPTIRGGISHNWDTLQKLLRTTCSGDGEEIR